MFRFGKPRSVFRFGTMIAASQDWIAIACRERRRKPLRPALGVHRLAIEPLEERTLLSADPLELGPLIDVSTLCDFDIGRMAFDRRTGEFSMPVAVTNASSDTIPSELYLVLAPASGVTVENAHGVTTDGRYYFSVESAPDDTTAAFVPGETSSEQVVLYTNPLRERVPLDMSVYVYPVQLTLEQGWDSLVIEQGGTHHMSYAASIVQVDGYAYNLTLTQTVTPDDGGIRLYFDYPPSWQTTANITHLVNQTISGLVAGSYTVTSTLTVAQTGDSVSTELPVYVVDPTVEAPELHQPLSNPDGVEVNTATAVRFSAKMTGLTGVDSLVLEQVDEAGNYIATVGLMKDDGLNGDFAANDGVFTASFVIPERQEGTLYYRTSLSYLGQQFYSESWPIPVLPFPIGPGQSDPSAISPAPGANANLYSDEVIVGFHVGTSNARIVEIADEQGASIEGTLPTFNFFQLRITGDGTATGVMATVELFEQYPEVTFAAPNYVATLDAVSPDDPQQWGFLQVRGDESWVLDETRSILVAVLDSGVDYGHNQLDGRVVLGRSFVGDDKHDVMDRHGHGTMVAGVIAANHDGVGISGISRSAKVLAVKAWDPQTTEGSALSIAASILYAANYPASVINISGGFYGWSPWTAAAVAYSNLRGSLVVATAGNDAVETQRYPAAHSGAIAVGATDSYDRRSTWPEIPGRESNFGDWVDIAAPGSSINIIQLGNNYITVDGTSFAAPQVAGAAAVLRAMNPTWTAAQVRQRLLATAAPLPETEFGGAGRLDLFEAVFNGSFEVGMAGWETEGTTATYTNLQNIVLPQDRERMGYASTGRSGVGVYGMFEKMFTVAEGVTSLPIEFSYAFLSQEYPVWAGSIFDDSFEAELIGPGGVSTSLAFESVNTSDFTMLDGVDFPGGDDTVGWTGWKPAVKMVSVVPGSQYTLRFDSRDAGDDLYDSVVLVDGIRFKLSNHVPGWLMSASVEGESMDLLTVGSSIATGANDDVAILLSTEPALTTNSPRLAGRQLPGLLTTDDGRLSSAAWAWNWQELVPDHRAPISSTGTNGRSLPESDTIYSDRTGFDPKTFIHEALLFSARVQIEGRSQAIDSFMDQIGRTTRPDPAFESDPLEDEIDSLFNDLVDDLATAEIELAT